MKRIFSVLAVVLMAGVMSSCMDTVDVHDGHIPADLLTGAQLWTGSYTGSINQVTNTINLRLDGDRPILTTTRDLIGDQCHSRIGLLRRISYEKQNGGVNVGVLTFDLDPGMCTPIVQGRTIDFEARMNGNRIQSLRVSYLDHTSWETHCSVTGGIYPPYQQCTQEPIQTFAEGVFNRDASLN